LASWTTISFWRTTLLLGVGCRDKEWRWHRIKKRLIGTFKCGLGRKVYRVMNATQLTFSAGPKVRSQVTGLFPLISRSRRVKTSKIHIALLLVERKHMINREPEVVVRGRNYLLLFWLTVTNDCRTAPSPFTSRTCSLSVWVPWLFDCTDGDEGPRMMNRQGCGRKRLWLKSRYSAGDTEENHSKLEWA